MNNRLKKMMTSFLAMMMVIGQSAVMVIADDGEEENTAVIAESEPVEESAIEEETVLSKNEESGPVEKEIITVPFTAGDGSTYEVTVYYAKNAGIPKDAWLEVSEITEEDQRYSEYAEETARVIGTDTADLNYIKLLDISIVNEAGKVYLHAPVEVSISLWDKEETADDIQVVHFASDEEIPEVVASTIAEDTVSFETEGFSVYAVVDGGPKTHTFEFYSPDEEGAYELYETVILKGEEILLQPEDPESGDLIFAGWYTDEECTEKFTGFDQPAPALDDETTEIYAKFTEKEYKITYYFNGSIITTDEEPEGTEYTFDAEYPEFVIQATEEGIFVNIAWNTAEDGTGTTYNTGDTVTVEDDMDLYAVIESRYLVDFISAGGSQTEAVYIKKGEKVTKPADPAWSGYEFAGWYTDKEYTELYDFNKEVTGSLKLYAKWTPLEVDYTVAVWVENDVYDETKTGEDLITEKYGYLGSVKYTALSDTPIDPADITGTYKTAADAMIRADRQGYMPYVFEEDFTLERNRGVTVSNDGSTLVNLYYRYKTLKVQFCTRGGAPMFGGQTIDTRYARSVIVKGTFAESVLNWTYYNTHYYNGRVIGGQWNILDPDNEKVGGYNYISTSQTLGGDIPDDTVYQLWDYSKSWTYTFARQYWTETLESSREDKSYQDADYEIYWDDRRQNNTPMEGAYAGGITGFTPHHDMTTGAYIQSYSTNPLYQYYCYSNQSAARPNPEDATEYYYYADGNQGKTRASFNSHAVSATKVEDGSECIARWYYSRNKYRIDLNKGIGPEVAGTGSILDIPYEEDLGRDEYKDPFSFINSAGEEELYIRDKSLWFNDGVAYVFRGFYENRDGIGEPFDFASETMPAYNVQLFAVWEPVTLTVKFDVNGGEWKGWESPDDEPQKTVSYGDNVARPTDPVKEGETFLGWTLNGKTFSFTTPIADNITLRALYADTNDYTLTYDKNGGEGDAPVVPTYLFKAEAVVEPGEGLTKDGNNFSAWADENGNLYYPGDKITITKDTVLYAQYGSDPVMTILKYDYNPSYKGYDLVFEDGNTEYVEYVLNNIKIRPDNTQGEYDDEDNGFYKTTGCHVPKGYRFLGWSLVPEPETEDTLFNKVFLPVAAEGDPETVDEILVDLEDEETKNVVYALWQRYETDLTVTKVSLDGTKEKPVNGAVFRLQIKNAEGQYVNVKDPEFHGLAADSTFTVKENGKVTLSALFDGEYKLTETKAPDGHDKLENAVEFTIEKGAVSYKGNDQLVAFSADEGFTVKNKPTPVNPDTYDSSHTAGWMWMFSSAVLLLAAAAMFRKRHA